jgi:hypothetical protein
MDGTLRNPTLGVFEAHGIVFDPCEGIGACRRRRRCSDPTMVAVAMRPAAFLRLSPPLATPRPSLGWIVTRIQDGSAICPPMLRVWLPPRIGNAPPAVTAHDGRHRMMALLAELGPRAEVPVHIELPTLPEDAEVEVAVIEAMRNGMRSQGGTRAVVPGPLFGAMDANPNRKVARTAIPVWLGIRISSRGQRCRSWTKARELSAPGKNRCWRANGRTALPPRRRARAAIRRPPPSSAKEPRSWI